MQKASSKVWGSQLPLEGTTQLLVGLMALLARALPY